MTKLTRRILDFVLGRGQATTREVIAAVGRYIPATKASKAGHAFVRQAIRAKHARPEKDLDGAYVLYQGKRCIINNALKSLTVQGHIHRVGRGVFTVPLPKIYRPEEKAG